MTSIIFAKIISIFGLAAYLTVATLNNIVDRGTNRFLLGQMCRMDLLSNDPVFAKGLIRRAIQSELFPIWLLNGIILIEIIICFLLWYGGTHLFYCVIFSCLCLPSLRILDFLLK